MSRNALVFHLLAIAMVVALGAGLDVMEVDAAQYAGMSRDMLLRDEWLELFYRDSDYLDKPPLLFWLSALSFKLFGVHAWSYRLPSILFAFLGLYSTYRFARLYHERDLAVNAALIFGSSAAFFLMCNDVRCDTILTGAVITAVWLGCAWLEQGRWAQLLGLSVAVAAAMLAKGPIGLVLPALAIGGQAVFTSKWERCRDPRLVVALFLLAVLLLPMCIGLYHQHGWHGVRFFFWEQSFGRITGENRWKDDSTVFFFTHEIIWQLLPWTVVLLVGIGSGFHGMLKRARSWEYASIVGGCLGFLALSLSQFKLPHYLYVTLPLFAVMAARGFERARSGRVMRIHLALVGLLWSALAYLVWTVFPEGRWPFMALVLAVGMVAVVLLVRHGVRGSAFALPFWTMIVAGLVMNGYFYPRVLHYQANAKAGQWAARQELAPGLFYGLQVSGSAMDFYAGYPVPWLSDAREARAAMKPGMAIYTDAVHRQELLDAGLVPRSEVRLPNHPAQRLSLPFLSPGRRAEVLEDRFIMRY
ncbi:MAG: glycosyltransferase family 39 protein [Flavobacteriales bacterium]|nr:glycosyltransferase family 39 protein [Flavobacteriales bacterium]